MESDRYSKFAKIVSPLDSQLKKQIILNDTQTEYLKTLNLHST